MHFDCFITVDRREPPFSHLAVADPGFPDVATHPRGGGVKLLFGKTFAENCMKIKEIGPLGAANASVQKKWNLSFVGYVAGMVFSVACMTVNEIALLNRFLKNDDEQKWGKHANLVSQPLFESHFQRLVGFNFCL